MFHWEGVTGRGHPKDSQGAGTDLLLDLGHGYMNVFIWGKFIARYTHICLLSFCILY